METSCREAGCRCPCHTVSEEQRAGALLALKGIGVPLLTALDVLGYRLTPELRAALLAVGHGQEMQDA